MWVNYKNCTTLIFLFNGNNRENSNLQSDVVYDLGQVLVLNKS